MTRAPNQKILVVDVSGATIRESIQILTRLGYTVTSVHADDDALDDVLHEKVDLVVLEYKGTSGKSLDVLEQARNVHPQLRSILISGEATPRLVRDAARRRLDAVVLKPFTSNELCEVVAHVLSPGRPPRSRPAR